MLTPTASCCPHPCQTHDPGRRAGPGHRSVCSLHPDLCECVSAGACTPPEQGESPPWEEGCSAESQPQRGGSVGGRGSALHGERICLLRTRSWGLLILFIYSILRFIKHGTGAFPSLVCVERIQAPHTTCRNVITRCVKLINLPGTVFC